MKRFPKLWQADKLASYIHNREAIARLPDGRYVSARPLGFCSLRNRIRCAWLVYTGRADAVEWEGQP